MAHEVGSDVRVTLRRESLWYQGVSSDRRGHFVHGCWSVFLHPPTVSACELVALPLLGALRHGVAKPLLVVPATGASFVAGEMRRVIDVAASCETPVAIEVQGSWSLSALQVLAALRPGFVRLGAEYTAGSGVIPEQARRLVQLADCFFRASVPLLAVAPLAAEDEEAVLAAGVDLRVAAESGEPGSPWPAVSLGAAEGAVVLDFPLRPPGR